MMSAKRRATQKITVGRFLITLLVIGATILGGWAITRRRSPGGNGALRDSDTAFSIPERVGQTAPAFTALGVDGQPYTVTPGDGHPKAIVFYMGYG